MAEQPQVSKQHAVPQEFFSVQFKLIGELTVRQFAVLAAFGLVATVIFISGIPVIVRWLLTLIVALTGVAFALVPVQDQPLDQWVGTLFRAVYSPTRRIWAKSGEAPEFLTLEVPKIKTPTEPGVTSEESRRRLREFLESARVGEPLTSLDLEEQQALNQINMMARQALPAQFAPAPALVVPTAPVETAELVKPGSATREEIEEIITPKEIEAPTPVLPELKFVEVQKVKDRPSLASRINWAEQVYKVQRGETASYFAPRKNIRVGRRLTPIAISGSVVYAPVRERVLEPDIPEAPTLPQLPSYPQESSAPTPMISPIPTPTPPPAEDLNPPAPTPKVEEPRAPRIEKKPAPAPTALQPKSAPRPINIQPAKLGEQTNLIFGVAHNPAGGALSNMLLVLKNEKGNVVRAAKTNELGRFSIGPLSNGIYSLELPQSPYPFATIKIELTGEKTAEMDLRPQGK